MLSCALDADVRLIILEGECKAFLASGSELTWQKNLALAPITHPTSRQANLTVSGVSEARRCLLRALSPCGGT